MSIPIVTKQTNKRPKEGKRKKEKRKEKKNNVGKSDTLKYVKYVYT